MDELWGVASHPGQKTFLTAGEDKKVMVWDGETHTVTASREIEVSITNAHNCDPFFSKKTRQNQIYPLFMT